MSEPYAVAAFRDLLNQIAYGSTQDSLVDQIKKAGVAGGFGSSHSWSYRIQQDPGELAQLIEALRNWMNPGDVPEAFRRRIESYLQIGSAAGGTERFICEHLAVKRLTIMDLGQHPEFHVWREKNRPALEVRGVQVTEYIGDTHEDAADEWLRKNGTKYDLIGIDGDHTPAGVRMDWKLIMPCLKPGSLVFLHDIHAEKMRLREQGGWEVWCKLKERHKVLLDVREAYGIGLVEIV